MGYGTLSFGQFKSIGGGGVVVGVRSVFLNFGQLKSTGVGRGGGGEGGSELDQLKSTEGGGGGWVDKISGWVDQSSDTALTPYPALLQSEPISQTISVSHRWAHKWVYKVSLVSKPINELISEPVSEPISEPVSEPEWKSPSINLIHYFPYHPISKSKFPTNHCLDN